MRRLLPLIGPLLLLATGLAALELRKTYIRAFFQAGQPALAPVRVQEPVAGPLRPVRVLLVDGLNRADALASPAMNRLCKRGLDLHLDVGFPTVSLPVQHVLWTGAWQQESGVQFVVGKLRRPALPSLPGAVRARGGQAVAVVQHHPEIAGSFPFSPVTVAGGGPQLRAAAIPAWRSGAALVFVHHLAVDDAGHRGGSGSPAYDAAIQDAETLLGELLAVTPAGAAVAVLSDHGHLPAPVGGHGGPEEALRLVRGCLAGSGVPAGSRADATLPDLTVMLAGRAGVPAPQFASGRDLGAVLAGSGRTRASLPGPNAWAILVSALLCPVLLLPWAAGLRRARRPLAALLATLPWGVILSLGLLWVFYGWPTLSRGVVFSASPWHLAAALWPAALLPAIQGLWPGCRGARLVGDRGRLLLWPWLLTPALAALILTGFPLAAPPILPRLTALASVLLLLAGLGLIALGGAGFVVRLLVHRRR